MQGWLGFHLKRAPTHPRWLALANACSFSNKPAARARMRRFLGRKPHRRLALD
jgi:hypothetical protein